jgi:Erv1 / Alr family
MKAFYNSMVDVLPCPICRTHYEANLEEMPVEPALKSRVELIQWVWRMHNRINVQLGKREFSFGEFIQSMRNLEKAKKSVPPSFTTSSGIAKTMADVSFIDGLLLGTGVCLILGAGAQYAYTELMRKGK